MLEIVICEDNDKILASMESMVSRIIRDHALQACIKYLASSVDDIEKFLQYGSANFFIMDIDLKSTTNGVQLADKIRKKFRNAYIVFVTGHLEFVFESFKVRPFNYISKPISFEVLENLIVDVYSNYLEDSSGMEDPKNILEITS